MELNNVVIKPIITEQSMKNAGMHKFTFAVNKMADKLSIKNAVEKKFSVHVMSVATMVIKGKSRRVGKKRIEKKYSPWKKAVVRVKDGEKIDMFDVEKS